MADRVTDSTASIRRGLNQHGCERIVLPSHIRVQSTKLTDISFVAYTDGLCPLCMVYQMAKEFATRRYQLTINNPKEHGYDHDTIKAILAKGAKLLYWCMCDEEGKEETYHTHLYLVFYNAVMFKTLKNKFPTAHIEVPQWGTNSENYAYIRKEGTKYHKDANGHYEYTDAQGKVHVGTNFSDTFEESGDLPPDAKQGDRNDLRMLYKLIASGEDNAQILGEHPEYLRDISHIDRTRQTILEEKYLLVATQRPDVGSVPGSLKAQLDGRICGHTADAQSSIVILDDGSAANLPAIPGRFIIRNGSETDDIVQAYYYHK